MVVNGPKAVEAGVRVDPRDTWLSNRARDVLSRGPVDSATLVRLVCAIPATPSQLAEIMAEEILGGRPEFARNADGLWCIAELALPPIAEAAPEAGAAPEAEAALLAPTTPAPAAPPPMTFEEWRAARDRARDSVSTAQVREMPAQAYRTQVTSINTRRRLEGCPHPDAELRSLGFAVVDLETTGGSHAAGHRITELAVVTVSDGAVGQVFETLVNPERVIPPMIVKLTGITSEMVRDKPRFRDVCEDVISAVRGQVFVAHNATFDWRFLSAEVLRATGRQLTGPKLCTVRLARRMLPHLRSRSLGYVADWYGADEFARTYFEGRHGSSRPWRHSAAGDAVATAHCLLRMIADAEQKGCRTWGDLEEMLGSPSPRRARRPRGRSGLPTPVQHDTTA